MSSMENKLGHRLNYIGEVQVVGCTGQYIITSDNLVQYFRPSNGHLILWLMTPYRCSRRT